MKRLFLLIVLAALTVFLLAACASEASPGAAAPPPPPGGAAMPAAEPSAPISFEPADEAPAPDMAFRMAAGNFDFAEAEAAAPTDYLRLPMLTPSRAGDRRLIYNVSMRLQTTEFMPGVRSLLDVIGEAGGYVVNYEIRGSDIRRTPVERGADFRFRLPTEELPEFIIFIENNYNILNLRQDMQEVTAEYQQTNWWLEDLREQERQLVEALATARGDRYTELSNQLAGIRWTIRDLEAQQARITTNVIYSTIEIQLFEAFLPEELEEEEETVQVVPIVITLLVLVVIILIVLLATKKSAPKKPEAPQSTATADNADAADNIKD